MDWIDLVFIFIIVGIVVFSIFGVVFAQIGMLNTTDPVRYYVAAMAVTLALTYGVHK